MYLRMWVVCLLTFSFSLSVSDSAVISKRKKGLGDDRFAVDDSELRENVEKTKIRRIRRDLDDSNDYLSSYYARRQAILDKYKTQQREIMSRLNKTKSLIAASQKLKESKSVDEANVTLGMIEDPSISGDRKSNASIRNASWSEFSPSNESISRLISDRREQSENAGSETLRWLVDTEEKTLDVGIPERKSSPSSDFSTRVNSETNSNHFSTERFDLLPRSGAEGKSEPRIERYERRDDNAADFLIVNEKQSSIGMNELSSLVSSANELLDEMFSWENEKTSSGNHDDFGSLTAGRDYLTSGMIKIAVNDTRDSSNVLGSKIDVQNSPGIRLTKRVKNVESSTNSSRDIVETDDNGENKTPSEDHVPTIHSENTDNVRSDATGNYGGADEWEWCEECSHDYRWGLCSGVNFYQHNIFLRNNGPSSIDAIFGMDAQGPVEITCVEALRFNETRGIVSLHSGGPGFDFVNLRIRGFHGEGFSYILKVWGIPSRQGEIE